MDGRRRDRSGRPRREYGDWHLWRLARLLAMWKLYRSLSHRNVARRHLSAPGAPVGIGANRFYLYLLFGWLPDVAWCPGRGSDADCRARSIRQWIEWRVPLH